MTTLEDVVFLGDKIPTEVLRILPVLPHISTRSISKVITLVVVYLTGELDKHKQELTIPLNNQLESELTKNFANVKKKKKSDEQNVEYAIKTGVFSVVFTGFYYIYRAAIRQRLSVTDLTDQLTKLTIPDELIKFVVQTYEKKREDFIIMSEKTTSWFNHVVDVRWRVDVTISTSVMTRVLKPVLHVQLELSNGDIRMMELSVQQFHELRLAVATVLNDMHSIQNHPIMQIQEKL
ncbi:hypothetical protein AKO1_015358 [Acrasis kona]|uniref:COMM domain-containing protein 5 n=1 Tax=Acrasis kona TaxID=1008807 RepID=A0AAW2ZGB1_9EUKA